MVTPINPNPPATRMVAGTPSSAPSTPFMRPAYGVDGVRRARPYHGLMSIRALSTAGGAMVVDPVARLGEPAWRARQIQAAVWQPYVTGFEAIQQLPAPLRQALSHEFQFSTVSIDVEAVADAGATVKLLRSEPYGTGFEAIQQLPAPLRQALSHEFQFSTVSIDVEAVADAGATVKLL